MEILALRLFDRDEYVPPTTASAFRPNVDLRKIDLSDSSSPVLAEEYDSLATVYGIVGPSIVSFGLIGNLLILIVVGRSSMSGKMIFFYQLVLSLTVVK